MSQGAGRSLGERAFLPQDTGALITRSLSKIRDLGNGLG